MRSVVRRRSSWSWLVSLATLSVVVCDLAACSLTTAPLPPNAERFAPPAIYARWWAMTEGCSGRTGDLKAVRWYRVPGFVVSVNGQDAAGYWSASDNRIVLTASNVDDGSTVRHEMLHSLLHVQGHPRAQFLGACASLVECGGSCITDGGAWRAPRQEYSTVVPDSLELDANATLRSPERDGQRWLALEVTVRNPSTRAVLVAVPHWPGTPPGGVDPEKPPGFAFDLRGPAGGIGGSKNVVDSSTIFFQPLETKAWLYEFRVSSDLNDYHIPPGRYSVRAGYARRWTAYDTISVTP